MRGVRSSAAQTSSIARPGRANYKRNFCGFFSGFAKNWLYRIFSHTAWAAITVAFQRRHPCGLRADLDRPATSRNGVECRSQLIKVPPRLGGTAAIVTVRFRSCIFRPDETVRYNWPRPWFDRTISPCRRSRLRVSKPMHPLWQNQCSRQARKPHIPITHNRFLRSFNMAGPRGIFLRTAFYT